MAELARTFPSVRFVYAATTAWDADAVDRWAVDVPLSHGELLTAQFLLAVWDAAAEWRCGRFDLMAALRVWDEQNRAAFLAWAACPWWP